MIEIKALHKIYKSKKRKKCHALSDINLTFPDAGLVFVLGKSGSGKSTLLNLIGGLDNITSGSIAVDGNDLARFGEKDFCNYRNSHIGFIFQDYHLIDELTVYENIRLSLDLVNKNDDGLISEALRRVDLAGYEDRYPMELSGGEQQRVAIARAIVKKPRIILADEPTGNLDTVTATAIVNLLKELSRECLILIVSHNVNDANGYADRIVELKKGCVISDKSRNPEFRDEVTFQGGVLVYPKDRYLSDSDIELMNANKSAEIVRKTDKFLPTVETDGEAKKIGLLNKNLKLKRELNLSGKFLKNKAFAISLSAFMVAVIMVIMALAQTIIAFDASKIIQDEMDKRNADAIYLTQNLSDEQKAMVSQTGTFSDCFPEIDGSEIQKFRDSGYKGNVYEVLKYNIHISQSSVSAGHTRNFFRNSPYILESIGTVVVDEAFLADKFGEVTYLARAEKFHSTGVIITDYLADAIMLSGRVAYARDYESLIGEYHWGPGSLYSCVSRGYINGIIETGYKEKYKDLFELIESGELASYADMVENERFAEFVEDVYGGLGFCYSLNPHFKEDALTDPSWEMLWHYTLSFDGENSFVNSTGPQIRKGSFYGIELADDEVIMDMEKYNEIFGTEYTAATVKDFVPREVEMTHYKHFDLNTPLFTEKVKIVGLFVSGKNDMGGTFLVGEAVWNLFSKDYIYTTGLFLDGNENLGAAIDVADALDFDQNTAIVEGIHTMTRAVDAFIPIFELIAVFLCVGVIFILVNFSSKMIKDKMHEIGILKALGTKNTSIGVVFGLQVLLIAILTCILSTVGYYFFIDLANDVLIESLLRLAPSQIVLDLDFLTFRPEIAAMNCGLIFLLALISLIFPMMRIKAIKPVKIIKVKD